VEDDFGEGWRGMQRGREDRDSINEYDRRLVVGVGVVGGGDSRS
jgi:hypothetical protein